MLGFIANSTLGQYSREDLWGRVESNGCETYVREKILENILAACCGAVIFSYTDRLCSVIRQRFLAGCSQNPMRFVLLDRVLAIDPGKSITAIKTLSLSEEYLADHFPRFPVMPGVLMLEAMTQAAAWTIRLGEDFAHSIVVLRGAKNVKYADFLEPGKTLTITVEVIGQDATTTKIKASGTIGDRNSLTARLVLERYNMADRMPYGDAVDARVRAEMRKLWSILNPADRVNGLPRHVVYGIPPQPLAKLPSKAVTAVRGAR